MHIKLSENCFLLLLFVCSETFLCFQTPCYLFYKPKIKLALMNLTTLEQLIMIVRKACIKIILYIIIIEGKNIAFVRVILTCFNYLFVFPSEKPT